LAAAPAYDADAQAYITAVIAADVAAGNTSGLEVGVQDAINAFVVGCKADGIWTPIKASCILAGARTLSGALVPLVGAAPTNVGPFASGDYNRETGLVGDGSTKYLDSNASASTASPQDDLHLALYLNAKGSNGRILAGARTSDSPLNTTQININSAGNLVGFVQGGATSTAINPSTPVFTGISRSSSSAFSRRVNGSTTSTSSTSAAPSNFDYAVFALNNQNTIVAFSDARLAFYSIGESLDLALLDTRVTTLINAIAAAIP
jgi:hypothetical protein